MWVLHPLEIADDHTAGIDVEIGKNAHAAGAEDLVGFQCHRAVGRFHDEMRLDALPHFRHRWHFPWLTDEHVARLFDACHIAGKRLAAIKSKDAARADLMLL